MNRKEFLRKLSAGLSAGVLVLPNRALAQAKTKRIRIGYLAALTGFASSSERVHLQGGELAQDWINSHGGIKIKNETYMVELVPEDHKSTAEGAVSGATKLVHDKGVQYIAGTIMPFTVAAVSTVTEPAGVLRSVGYNAGTPQEFSDKTPYTFLSSNGTIGYVISGMRWLKQKFPDTKTVSVLIPDDGAIPYLEPHVRKWAEANGMSIKGDIVGWPLDTLDFTPFALKAANLGADAVAMVNGWAGMVGSVLKALRKTGFSKPAIGMHYLQLEDVLEVAGLEASNNYYIHGLVQSDRELPEKIKWILETGTKKYGQKSLTFWAEGFDPVYTIAQAIGKAQSLDPDAIRKAWEQMDTIDTCYGPAKMGGLKTYGLRHAVVGPRSIAGLERGKPAQVGWIRDIVVP